MGLRVLLRSPKSSSKAWIQANSKSSGVVTLDPASTHFGTPGRIVHGKADQQTSWKFVGSLTPNLNPIRYVSAVCSLLSTCDGDAIVECAPIGSDALSVEIARAVLQVCESNEILVDQRLSGTPWTDFGELLELEKVEDAKVRRSIRKAQWFKLRQDAHTHKAILNKTRVLGSRLGSGSILEAEFIRSIGLPSHSRVESAGAKLLIVSSGIVADDMVSRALDSTDCTRAVVVDPERYSNLLCCIFDSEGRELGIGFIQRISLEDDLIEISSKAAAPAPIASIQLGNLYVDSKGVEMGEIKLFEI